MSSLPKEVVAAFRDVGASIPKQLRIDAVIVLDETTKSAANKARDFQQRAAAGRRAKRTEAVAFYGTSVRKLRTDLITHHALVLPQQILDTDRKLIIGFGGRPTDAFLERLQTLCQETPQFVNDHWRVMLPDEVGADLATPKGEDVYFEAVIKWINSPGY